jgi:dUTP pyrophosphatase
MIKFYKVSYEQFKKDIENSDFRKFSEEEVRQIYDDIKLPKRATKASAGYDFFAPYDLCFDYKISFKFPTGIRCEMDEDTVLILVPRSSLGFKYRLGLDNTLGIIDAKI